MKTWLKTCGKILKRYDVEILESLITAVLMAGFLGLGFFLRGTVAVKEVSFWKSVVFTPEPEYCTLCGNGERRRYHPPCMIKLATGEVGELRVYDPDPQRVGELLPVQRTGTFAFQNCADLVGYRDTSKHVSHVTVPEEQEPIDPARFCRDCRALLTDAAVEGYVLLDLYDRDRITVYPIEDGAQYTIRDYTVSISGREGSRELDIDVAGSLHLREQP